ncbi:MAG: non-canonical purine NTP diphosphatase [Flavobacteriaceae bacterium]|nr:non-canonical purine NTP diphosphatase [Mangrovimonas sp.]MCB0438611.1 non-canonical purine NTP diphosphatase [Mangrovimonas sp.]
MQLVFATNNRNKLKEVQALVLEPIQLLSLEDIDCLEDIPETQLTIEGNAIQKIEYLKKHYNIDGFADDTGLEVKALHGEPGVFSARYAGDQRNAQDNMDKLLKNLEGKTNRSAQFKTVIALTLKGQLHTFTGICKGTILTEKRGDQGFGYDPIFQPEGYEQTFAEMDLALKNQIGHRGKAIKQLVQFLNKK